MTSEEKRLHEQQMKFNIIDLLIRNNYRYSEASDNIHIKIIEDAQKYWDWMNDDSSNK